MNDKCREPEIVVSQTYRESDIQSDSEICISGYSDLQKIAEGASGVVFAARREVDGRSVAIKVYKKDLAPNPESIRRFKDEVDTLSTLSHSNIVSILGQGITENDEPYIVMENVEGQSLRTILDTEGALEPNRAVVVAREVCRALTAAHEKGIVHRDLKPNNIIIDKNNIAKVVDFGVAKAVGSSNDTITEYGAIIGTPAYMSPEQCLGEHVDSRSDVYSLGCTLFEMLTKTKAFESNTAIEALAKQIYADRSHIQQGLLDHKIPEDLQRIVRRCLERQPDNRFKSAADLEHELSAYLLNVPLSFGTHSSAPKASLVTQIVICSCLLVVMLMVFESILWSGRMSIEMPPIWNAQGTGDSHLNSGQGAFQIRNRMNGKILYTGNAKMTLKEAIQDAADRHISLAYADLKDANLAQAHLNNVDFSCADLSNAKFTQSYLTDVNFNKAILTKSQFIQANLQNVSMQNAMMSACSMSQCRAPNVILSGADLSFSNLTSADLLHAKCRFTNFTEANMSDTTFRDADTSGANFQRVRGTH